MSRWLLAAALALSPVAGAHPPGIEAPLPIMVVPPALHEQFEQRVLAGHPSRGVRLERLVEFVFDEGGLGMRYAEGASHTVEESFATREANCLGFTLLFVALAREAGLDAWPQAWEETLSWHRTEGLLYRNSHVNAVVRIGPRDFTLDMARGAVITRGRPVRLTAQDLLAAYYNNKAVEAMQGGDLPGARRLMATALGLDGRQASHWSNAGVLALQSGDRVAARRAYDNALSMNPEHSNALFNRISIARREGDRDGEARFRERLAQVQRKDPFHHFLQAVDHELAGDFRQAVVHYRKAARLHRGDHRFHAALAGALERSGQIPEARKALARAATLSEGAVRDAYRARIEALR